MLLPPISARLRALAPAVVVVAIGAALILPRPGSETTAIPAATYAPYPQELLTPVVIEAPRATIGSEAPAIDSTAQGSPDPGAGTPAPVEPAPGATPVPRPSTAVPAGPRPPRGPTHVVVAGDNLWTIARSHSAPLTAILRWNDGLDPSRLVAGQRILVPGGTTIPAARAPAPPRPTTPRAATVRPSPRPAAPSRSTGGHTWPLAVRGMITTAFSSAHRGIDIAASLGTPVRVVAGGIVAWAGWLNNGGGNVVVVRHPNGMRSTYNHTSTILVRVGQAVAAGETIARVGSTGWSSGPHLDFRIEMGGRFVDPLDYL